MSRPFHEQCELDAQRRAQTARWAGIPAVPCPRCGTLLHTIKDTALSDAERESLIQCYRAWDAAMRGSKA